MTTETNNEQNNNDISVTVTLDIHDEHDQEANKTTEDLYTLARTIREKTCFRTIQSALNRMKIVLRTIKDSNVLYICSEDQWKEKVKKYVDENNHFQFIGSFHSETSSNNPIRYTLITNSNQIVKTLHTLFFRKAITTEQYEKMMYYNQTTICNINRLYFIPEIRHVSFFLSFFLSFLILFIKFYFLE